MNALRLAYVPPQGGHHHIGDGTSLAGRLHLGRLPQFVVHPDRAGRGVGVLHVVLHAAHGPCSRVCRAFDRNGWWAAVTKP